MQLVVETLVQAVPSVVNVMMFGAFLFGIYAILGVQLFSGRLSQCNQVGLRGRVNELCSAGLVGPPGHRPHPMHTPSSQAGPSARTLHPHPRPTHPTSPPHARWT